MKKMEGIRCYNRTQMCLSKGPWQEDEQETRNKKEEQRTPSVKQPKLAARIKV